MAAIIVRAACFVSIIILGYLLRRIGFFKKEDFSLLSGLVIKVTAPAAIISSFIGRELDGSMFILSLIGFVFCVLLMVMGYLTHRRLGRDAQAFAVINTTGCNIGCFALPFAQGFLGPVSVMAVCLYDMGNGLICLGSNYGIACSIKEGSNRFSFKPIFKALSRSVPLITYIVMIVLTSLKLPIPSAVSEFTGIVGRANAFLAMLTIGVGFELEFDKEHLRSLLRVILPRFLTAIICAALCYTLLPFPAEYRKAIVICMLAPISNLATAYTNEIKGDVGLSCAINSVAIVISICFIVFALVALA